MTHTLATLEVLPSTYADIQSRLFAANYDHAIDVGRGTIDMTGIMLMQQPSSDKTVNSVYQRFKVDALQHVGLHDHPKRDDIWKFALGQSGDPLIVLWALEHIASFIVSSRPT